MTSVRFKLGRIAMVAVQAIDGRWNYAPAHLADALKSEEHGPFETWTDAVLAADASISSLRRNYQQ